MNWQERRKYRERADGYRTTAYTMIVLALLCAVSALIAEGAKNNYVLEQGTRESSAVLEHVFFCASVALLIGALIARTLYENNLDKSKE